MFDTHDDGDFDPRNDPPPAPPGGYKCAVCKVNPVDAANGYDTCDDCLRRV